MRLYNREGAILKMDLPFLCQTRTILGRSSTLSSRRTAFPVRRRARCIHQETEHPASRSVDVQRWATARSFFRVKAEELEVRKPDPLASSITREEQRAFNSLLRLAKQRQQYGSQVVADEHSLEADRLNTDPLAIFNLFLPASSSDQNKDLLTFICRDRIQHISKLYNDALQSTTETGDIALWNVLQTHVFSLSEVLKPTSEVHRKSVNKVNQLLDMRNLAQQYRKEHQQRPAPPDSQSTSTTSEPLPTPLAVLTPLYPATLLLALRLLTINHPLSPLSHSLLDHITQLGPSSYVLAASTPFYNTHLFLRWQCFSSLSELGDLLAEMERGGVDFDRGTLRFLKGVGEERDRDLRGDVDGNEENLGRRGADWWMKGEQLRSWGQVAEWTGAIAKRLEEKGLGEVLREGPEGTMNAGTESQVWL